MLPTLFGVTVACFFIMKQAPGDPLKMQISSGGAQGESTTTREAYLHQRKQWNLDKPNFLNARWSRDYTRDVRFCSFLQSMPEEETASLLARLAGEKPEAAPSGVGVPDDELLEYLRDLEVEDFDTRLKDAERRADFSKKLRIGVQLRVESLSDYGVKHFIALLAETREPRLRLGAVRCLSIALLGDPFVYTYSKEPAPEETEGVVATWGIWWAREKSKFPAPLPERREKVEALFRTLVAEPSRGKILEGVKGFEKNDAPFLAGQLFGGGGLQEKYVSSLALRSWIGRPLMVDVKVTDPPDRVEIVVANWQAFYSARVDRFSPGFLKKAWLLVSDTQYANAMVKLITFDFGKSMLRPYDPVGPKIWTAVKVSAPIMLLVEALVYIVAVPLGIACAIRRGKWQDRAISLQLFLAHSIPTVVSGMLFLTVFCYGIFLKWFPISGLHSEGYEQFSLLCASADYAWHLAGPVIVLAGAQMAYLAMYSRTSMLDVVNQDYIRTAKAKGLPESAVVLRHALRNALIPVITLFSNFIPALLGGSVIVEVLFGVPGMGLLSFESINAKDYNTVMAVIFIDALIVMASILLSDLLYVLVDPRISFSKAEAGA